MLYLRVMFLWNSGVWANGLTCLAAQLENHTRQETKQQAGLISGAHMGISDLGVLVVIAF